MTTVRSGVRDADPSSAPEPGLSRDDRRRRRLEGKRLVREQILAVIVLAVALAATLVILGLQWLSSGGGGTPANGGAAGVLTPLTGVQL